MQGELILLHIMLFNLYIIVVNYLKMNACKSLPIQYLLYIIVMYYSGTNINYLLINTVQLVTDSVN